jgi:uncharacterized membrane protein
VIQDPALLLAYLAGVVAVVFQLSRIPRFQPLFDRLPALVWAYWLPMLSTTAGLIPSASPLYGSMTRYLLPASLALMLLSSEVKSIARLGRTALLAGIIAGAVIAFATLRPWLPAEAWKAVGALSATWIGGSANLVAVATALGLSPDLQGVIIIVDTVVGYSWMALLIAFAGSQVRFDTWNNADRAVVDDVGSRLAGVAGREARPLTVPDATLLVGLAIGLTAISLRVGAMLPPVGQVLTPFSWAIVLLSTVALGLSLTPLAKLEGAGASTLGYAGFYLLLASVGAQADLTRILAHPTFVLLGAIIITVHALCLLLAVRLLRAPLLFYAAASQACTGGVASAPIVAAIYHPAMAPVGLLLAVLGNVLGTYLGLVVAQLLFAMS